MQHGGFVRQSREPSRSSGTIRIPVHMVGHQSSSSCSAFFDSGTGREPEVEEIAEEMGIPVEKVREIQKISQGHLWKTNRRRGG